MNYALYIARRLQLASGGARKAPAVKVAIAAVALSVGVMLAAVAIVSGFKREIRAKITGFNSHVTLFAVPGYADDSNIASLSDGLKHLLDSIPYVTDYSLQASAPAILKTPDNFKGIYLKSANGEHLSRFLTENIEEGEIPDFSARGADSLVVLSRKAADALDLHAGDKIDTYFITDRVNVRRLRIAGIYNSHFDSYDDLMAFGSLGLIQRIGHLRPNQGTSVQITTDDFDRLPQYTSDLQERLVEALNSGLVYRQYQTENALSQGAGYFHWLQLLDTNVAVVLALMTFVACITLISGLLILILDKKRQIGLLRAMGAPVSAVRKVFVYLALKVAVGGLLIGNSIMLLLLRAQERWHIVPLDADNYYIDFVPVKLTWEAVAILNAAVLIVIWMALILPSWFVAKIRPAETMRYE